MAMDCARRAALFLMRRKGKAAGLLATTFVMAAFLFCAFGVLQASERLTGETRASLGGALYLRAPTQAVAAGGAVEVGESRFGVDEAAVKDVLALGGISACNPVNYGLARGEGFAFVPGSDRGAPGGDQGKVAALRSSALAAGFVDEGDTLVEGRHIAQGDARKVLVSEALAQANGLAVGDEVTLAAPDGGDTGPAAVPGAEGAGADASRTESAPDPAARTATAKIVGLFRPGAASAPGAPAAGRAENRVYATLDVLDALGESTPGVYTGEVAFYVRDPATLPSLAREVERLGSIDWDASFVRANDFRYERVADQPAETAGLTRALIGVAAVANILILGLTLILRARARMREAGSSWRPASRAEASPPRCSARCCPWPPSPSSQLRAPQGPQPGRWASSSSGTSRPRC